MKKLNENQKITLTFGQLKRLVAEGATAVNASKYPGMPPESRERVDDDGRLCTPAQFYDECLDDSKYVAEIRALVDPSVKLEHSVIDDPSAWPYYIDVKLETPDGRKWAVDYESAMEYTDIAPDGKYVFTKAKQGDSHEQWNAAKAQAREELAKYVEGGVEGVDAIIETIARWNEDFDEAFQDLKEPEGEYSSPDPWDIDPNYGPYSRP